MACYNRCGQLNESVCPVCKKPFILQTGGKKGHPYIVIDKSKERYGKKIYCCCYKCFKQMEYENIIQKEKLTKNEVNWLLVNGYDVPVEKAPKWVQDELMEEAKKKNGI